METLLPSRKNDNWPESLAFEIALGYYPPEELAPLYDMSLNQLLLVQKEPLFDKMVKYYRREIEKGGEAFKLKARKIANELLDELMTIALNEHVPPSDRRLCIEAVCRYAGFDKQQVEQGSNQMFQLVIQLDR